MVSRKLSISRRPSLPRGISYHDTPQGLKYRIRIRSEKILSEFNLSKPIDEIYETLKEAEERIITIKYRKPEAQKKFIADIVDTMKTVTLEALLEVHYEKYYKHLKAAKEHKSRMKMICKTLVPCSDPRLTMMAHIKYSYISVNTKEIPYGMVSVKDYDIYLNAFIDKRRKEVKNQTIVNDLMFLNTAIKNAHNYFKDLPTVEKPLKNVNYKTLKDQTTYRDKRLKPESRIYIEQLLIEKSRDSHYYEFFVLLHQTGCRLSEGLSIRVADIDLEKNTIFLISKKNNMIRYLPISEILKPIIENRIIGKKKSDKLFPHSFSTYQSKIRQITPFLVEQGIKFTWHDLRHNFISTNFDSKDMFKLMSELDIHDIQHFQQTYANNLNAERTAIKLSQAQQLTHEEMRGLVGHSSLQMTKHYTHQKEPQKQVVEPTNELLAMLKEQQEQLKQQQQQIEQLLKLSKKD